MMHELKGIDLAGLSNKELKFIVREFCRRRLVEGYHRDEVSILAKREFSELLGGEEGKISKQTLISWVSQLYYDVINAERDNKRDLGRNLAIAQQRLEHLYNLCIRKGEIKLALRALKDLHELQSLTDGKVVLNLGFQQNVFGSGGESQGQHNSGSIPAYTPYSTLTTDELKQKLIEYQHQVPVPAPVPVKTFDVLQSIKKTQEEIGKVVYIEKDEATQLIDAHNAQFSNGKT